VKAMYNVLIVDDEPIIRNGIKAFIDWEKEGMRAEADCANGVEALAAMESRPADILITDIKMPLMSGIQLMQRALQLYPRLKVIMVSSYSDFEFAREGLKLGAVDYLLKPTLEAEELMSVLKRCTAMLEEENKKQSELTRYHVDSVYRDRKKLEHAFKRMMVQEHQEESSNSWAPAWMGRNLLCAFVMLDRAEELRETYGNLHAQLLLEELQESFYRHIDEGIGLLASETGLFVVLPDYEGNAEALICSWKSKVKDELAISISLGISALNGISEIRQGFVCSRTACQRRFFEGLGGIYSANVQQQCEPGGKVNAIPAPAWTELAEQIRGRMPISTVMEKMVERWKQSHPDSEQVKQEACSLLTEVYQIYGDTGTFLPERLDLVRHAESLDQLDSILTRQLEELGRLKTSMVADKGHGGQLITKALEYMAGHFKEDLTLQSTADAVHISKSYFSLLFKKQTGHNFIDYLIDLRIREAKRLLTVKDSRIYEVAEAAGFNDVKYFSKLFKKMTGLTPMEFREQGGKLNEKALDFHSSGNDFAGRLRKSEGDFGSESR
jgi:two-component system response regulator YesN